MKTATKKRKPAGQQDGIASRPILFSAPMVRAILDGRKTMTRRVIRQEHAEGIELGTDERFSFMHSPKCGGGCDYACASSGETLAGHIGWTPWGSNPRAWGRLWVRETWSEMPGYRPIPNPEKYDNKPAWYKADNDRPVWAGDKWRPSIFMRREVSRITLEVTGVRVERLMEITEEDAIAEGAQCAGFPASLTNRGAFARLWEKINGADSWTANPWVWVVEFKRV